MGRLSRRSSSGHTAGCWSMGPSKEWMSWVSGPGIGPSSPATSITIRSYGYDQKISIPITDLPERFLPRQVTIAPMLGSSCPLSLKLPGIAELAGGLEAVERGRGRRVHTRLLAGDVGLGGLAARVDVLDQVQRAGVVGDVDGLGLVLLGRV